MELTPVVKYLIIVNVSVFVLQLFLTRPAVPRAPDLDAIWIDDEEADPDPEHLPEKKKAITPEDHQNRERNARKAREAMEQRLTECLNADQSFRSGSISTRERPSSKGRSGGSLRVHGYRSVWYLAYPV